MRLRQAPASMALARAGAANTQKIVVRDVMLGLSAHFEAESPFRDFQARERIDLVKCTLATKSKVVALFLNAASVAVAVSWLALPCDAPGTPNNEAVAAIGHRTLHYFFDNTARVSPSSRPGDPLKMRVYFDINMKERVLRMTGSGRISKTTGRTHSDTKKRWNIRSPFNRRDI
jgi:hypothetical protein